MLVDSSDPRPAFRAKITVPKLTGRLPPLMLFVADMMTVTIDVRPSLSPPSSPGAARAHDFATAAAPRPHDFATAAPPTAAASPAQVASGNGRAWWNRPSVLVPGATILMLGTLASNVATWGADIEADPAAFAMAGSMMTRAFAR